MSILCPDSWSRGLRRNALNSYIRMRRWFHSRQWRHFRPVYGIDATHHREEFWQIGICSDNSGLESQQPADHTKSVTGLNEIVHLCLRTNGSEVRDGLAGHGLQRLLRREKNCLYYNLNYFIIPYNA